ncbi:hypothetical protein [uncultured Duncaniella sp.]|uniref:hypothetical protein n=1 Tax=uncultured Duncaniella sp. TaxID=2768039 RepID=UPI00351D724C
MKSKDIGEYSTCPHLCDVMPTAQRSVYPKLEAAPTKPRCRDHNRRIDFYFVV